MSVPIMIDSDVLSVLLSRPLCLSVTVMQAEEYKDLEARCKALQAECARLQHSYACATTLLGKFRDFCRVQGISLPNDLSFVTPWG